MKFLVENCSGHNAIRQIKMMGGIARGGGFVLIHLIVRNVVGGKPVFIQPDIDQKNGNEAVK